MVYNSPRRNEKLNTAEMHDRIGIGELHFRRNLYLCGQMYRRSRNPKYIDNRNLATRQFDKIVLKTPGVILTKTFQSPIYKGSQLWNSLPQEIQNCETYTKFKYQYKEYILGRLQL